VALFGLLKPRPHERAAFALYGQAVAQARQPFWYGPPPTGPGVPDTLDGRFDMVGVFVFLLLDRLRTDPDKAAGELAQAVFDAMFADMDQSLREMGVGDLSVGKRVKAMWTAFNGRAYVYSAALTLAEQPQGDSGRGDADLLSALSRNVWRSEATVAGATVLGRYMLAARRVLAAQPLAALQAGQAAFPAPPDAG
jgi:cytochrome b pre-mRNA-processing protein 3